MSIKMESQDWIHQAYDKIWRNAEAATEERHGVQCLPSYFPTKKSQVVVVREEYPKIWEYVKSMYIGRDPDGLVIGGQPGIGKSSFLLYAMAMAMQEKIPVAFCEDPGSYVLCDKNGCVTYPTSPVKQHREFFLALVDSNAALEAPPAPFLARAQPCYTIQATSPKVSRWKAWAKEKDAVFWIMPLWSEEEIIKLQNLYEQENKNVWGNGESFYTPLETFRLLGPSARKCFYPRGHRKTQRGPTFDLGAALQPRAIFHSVDAFIDALSDGLIPDREQGDTFHHFLFGTDGSNSGNPSDGMVLRYHVPTTFLRRILSRHFRSRGLEEQTVLAAKFSPYPQVAGVIYEPLVIDFLLSEKSHRCCLVDGSAFTFDLRLSVADQPVNFKEPFDTNPKDDCIYVPPPGFPSIDAIIISHDKTRVTFLQMRLAQKHSVKAKDCHTVMRSMRELRTVQNWSFIFVTPNDNGRIMAEKVNSFPVGRKKILLRMGWLRIDGAGGSLADVLQKLAEADVADVEDPTDDVEVLDSDAESDNSASSGPSAKRLKTAN